MFIIANYFKIFIRNQIHSPLTIWKKIKHNQYILNIQKHNFYTHKNFVFKFL